jgi:hypothetical protein
MKRNAILLHSKRPKRGCLEDMKEKISLKKKEFGKFEYVIENFEANHLVFFPDRSWRYIKPALPW